MLHKAILLSIRYKSQVCFQYSHHWTQMFTTLEERILPIKYAILSDVSCFLKM